MLVRFYDLETPSGSVVRRRWRRAATRARVPPACEQGWPPRTYTNGDCSLAGNKKKLEEVVAILEAGHKLPFTVQPATIELPELQVGWWLMEG